MGRKENNGFEGRVISMIVRASIEGKQLSYGCWLLAVAVDGTSSIVNFLFISFFLYLYIYILEENSAFIYIYNSIPGM